MKPLAAKTVAFASLLMLAADGQPPGERNPLLGLLAAASIVIVLAAGIYVYRVIRKGL
ncbi:MAG: hypothetical protein ACR2FO_05700 [Actinomycetota bacterium]